MCMNCGETGSMRSGEDKVKCPQFCNLCSTPEKRAKMKEEHEKIIAEKKEVKSNHGKAKNNATE